MHIIILKRKYVYVDAQPTRDCVVLMLGRRRRQRADIKTIMGQRLMLAG